MMAVVPIGTYFTTLHYFTKGKYSSEWNRWTSYTTRREETGANLSGSTTISAICAIITANIVLVGYVVVAFREDAAYQPPAVREKITEKKTR
jgi:hypothetical protein